MSKSDTWMPFYVGDYLADTMHLTAEQHGAYFLLLMHQWRSGPLPDQDVQLCMIAHCELAAWKKRIAPIVRRFFTVTPDGLVQKRLAFEKNKAIGGTEKKSEGGKIGAARRWGKDGTDKGSATGTPITDADGIPVAHPLAEPMGSQWQNDAPSPSPIKAAAGRSKSPRANGHAPPGRNTPRLSDPPAKWLHLTDERELDDAMVTHPVVGGHYLDLVAIQVCEAARINDASWRGDWKPIIDWLQAGFDADRIVAVISKVASRPTYQPPKSLRYFDDAMRETGKP